MTDDFQLPFADKFLNVLFKHFLMVILKQNIYKKRELQCLTQLIRWHVFISIRIFLQINNGVNDVIL